MHKCMCAIFKLSQDKAGLKQTVRYVGSRLSVGAPFLHAMQSARAK